MGATNSEQPYRVDLDDVVAELGKLSVPAHVEQTGGGTATIYAGSLADWPDAGGDRRYAVAAGPGWFNGPGWTNPAADTSDFYVGPDDDGDTPGVKVAEGTQPAVIAALIADTVRAVYGRRKRIAEALESAADAFWDVVASEFPEVEGGDFDPASQMAIDDAMRVALLTWLRRNQPPESDIAATRNDGSAQRRAAEEAAAARVLAVIQRSRITTEALQRRLAILDWHSARASTADDA